MSEHVLQPYEPDKFSVVIGYDPVRDSFFGQVRENAQAGSDRDLIKVAKTTLDLGELRNEIAPYAELTVAIGKQLLSERMDRENHPMHLVVDHRHQSDSLEEIGSATIFDDSADPAALTSREVSFDDRELNTVLASLRQFQSDIAAGKLLDDDVYVVPGLDFALLSSDDVDELCEYMNLTGSCIVEDSELATIVVALQHFDEAREASQVSVEIMDIATNGRTAVPLSSVEIQGFVERLTSDEQALSADNSLQSDSNAGTKNDAIMDLPVFSPRASDIVTARESMRSGVAQTMSVAGRSADGDRVFGRVNAGNIVSVSRDAFTAPPKLNDSLSIRRIDGRDIIEPADRELSIER